MPDIASFVSLDYAYPKASFNALNRVSMSIPKASVFALLGPNGAGKTTLLRLLCGRMQPKTGKIVLDSSLRKEKNDASKNISMDPQKVGVLLENPGVYSSLTVQEYLLFFARLYQLQNPHLKIQKLLDDFDFKIYLNQKMGRLSLGNRQKVQIARCFLHHPELVILDEPVAHLDPISRIMVWEYLLKWSQSTGGTLVVCSHVLAELEEMVTDYAFIKEGEIIQAGQIEDFNKKSMRVLVTLNKPVNEQQLKILFEGDVDLSFTTNAFSFNTSNAQQRNPWILEKLVQEKIEVLSIEIQKNTLSKEYQKYF